MENNSQLPYLGLFLIFLGIILVFMPFLTRFLPDFEKIPWFMIWVYKTDGFTFVTSPILLILSLISLIYYFTKS
jgi:hypothetical protein